MGLVFGIIGLYHIQYYKLCVFFLSVPQVQYLIKCSYFPHWLENSLPLQYFLSIYEVKIFLFLSGFPEEAGVCEAHTWPEALRATGRLSAPSRIPGRFFISHLQVHHKERSIQQQDYLRLVSYIFGCFPTIFYFKYFSLDNRHVPSSTCYILLQLQFIILQLKHSYRILTINKKNLCMQTSVFLFHKHTTCRSVCGDILEKPAVICLCCIN